MSVMEKDGRVALYIEVFDTHRQRVLEGGYLLSIVDDHEILRDRHATRSSSNSTTHSAVRGFRTRSCLQDKQAR
jgi:hypothetical protein